MSEKNTFTKKPSDNQLITWEEYKKKADRTVSDLNNNFFLHAALGINTECIEFFTSTSKQNAIEEIGDIFWYIALLSNRWERVIPFRWTIDAIVNHCLQSSIIDGVNTVSHSIFLNQAGEVVNQAKRNVFYGSDIDQEKIENAIVSIIFYVRICIKENKLGNIYDILSANIEKLEKRFPEKFNQEDAENRDVDNELNHIKPE